MTDEKFRIKKSQEIAFLCEKLQLHKPDEEKLEEVCNYSCPVHKLATHNACLTCSAVRNSPHHNLKNVSNEELQKIIKEAEAEMEM